MLSNLHRHVMQFLMAGPLEATSLGRCTEKFGDMLAAVRSLPFSRPPLSSEELGEFVCSLQSELDPYGKSADRAPANTTSSQPVHESRTRILHPDCSVVRWGSDELSDLGVVKLSSGTAYKEVVADRIKWEHAPTFDATPFLSDPLVKAAFRDHNDLRLPESD